MKNQKYTVKLTVEERKELERFIRSRSPKNTPECKKHAKVLLCLDENGEKPLSVKETSAKCKFHEENIYSLRKQYVLEGLDRVLHRKKRETPPVPAKITGEIEAHIIATACSTVPEGRKAWTLSMIAKKIVLEGVIESICPEVTGRNRRANGSIARFREAKMLRSPEETGARMVQSRVFAKRKC